MNEQQMPMPARFARKEVYGYLKQAVQESYLGHVAEATDLLSQARALAEASVHYERAMIMASEDVNRIEREIGCIRDASPTADSGNALHREAELLQALERAHERMVILLATRP